ncbi:hypothetical protein ACIQ8D_23975 [Streptomyces sp. NPDC096094]|uniref:hypothetical protein n=1 Tax=Streptomyces sp. NPDC096094 TaxID=3366073 RepID=UPI00380EB736
MRTKEMEPAPLVGMPLPDPAPSATCDVCQALARQRAAARDAGNLSRVSDCNVEIRNHPHKPRRP